MSRTKTAPSLLDNPATVTLLRDLYAHADAVGARHGRFGWAGLGGRVAGWEHVWTDGVTQVAIEDGWLIYRRGTTARMRLEVSSVADAVRLLVALGVLPDRFAQLAARTAGGVA